MRTLRYTAVRAAQAPGKYVFSFAANPKDVLTFATVDGVKRNRDGSLGGFQRHQIAPHIKEIRAYLSREDALLPNAVVVAFIHGACVKDRPDGLVDVEIEINGETPPGFVVDGQQRLTALSGMDKPGFEVFVSALVCDDYNELRQQFVLINNTRPLPKALIYELLPNIDGLPERFSKRSFAARMVEKLNYTRTEEPVFYGRIHQHTNARGKLSDLAVQRLIMDSADQGAIREFIAKSSQVALDSIPIVEERAFELIHTFFSAVKEVFGPAWNDMTPKTSRLVHGAGLVAMGYVMETLYAHAGRVDRDEFVKGLRLIAPKCAWVAGRWTFSRDDQRPWNGIQNTSTDIDLLANYLVRELRRALRRQRAIEEFDREAA
jgi:DGQHR domain-containing protein